MIISVIAALARNSVIGNKNEIPWYLPADLKHFAKITSGHSVIMGRNTYLSIIKRLGHPLKERKNMVMTPVADNLVAEGCVVVNSFAEALRAAEGDEVFIIGGAQVYQSTFPQVQRMYLTWVDAEVEGDAFFPEFRLEEWNLVSQEEHLKDDKNNFNYKFMVYDRKK